jgi:probable HAF family extracellular repeat protein
MQDLNNLLAPDSDWTLASANGINDRGQIVGYGIGHLPNGPHAFLLNPAPVRH